VIPLSLIGELEVALDVGQKLEAIAVAWLVGVSMGLPRNSNSGGHARETMRPTAGGTHRAPRRAPL
jgi:hypothetical protein